MRVRQTSIYNEGVIEKRRAYSRREVLRAGLAAIAFTVMPGDALSRALEHATLLKEQILSLYDDVRVGGALNRDLHDAKKWAQQLDRAVPRIQYVSRELGKLHASEPLASTNEFLVAQNVPGVLSGSFVSREKTNTGAAIREQRCNLLKIDVSGVHYLVTAQHCIKGMESEQYFTHDDAIGDVAVHRSSAEVPGVPLGFDMSRTSADIQGLLGVTVSKANDAFVMQYGVLMPMTAPLYAHLIEENEHAAAISPTLKAHIKSGYWKVLSDDMADTRSVGTQTEVQAAGLSGSVDLAYDARRGGYTPGGLLIAVMRPNAGPLRGLSIGFYTGPEAIRKAIELEQQRFEQTKSGAASAAPRS